MLVANLEQVLRIDQDGALCPEKLLYLLERDGPGDELVDVNEQTLCAVELELDELDAVSSLAPDALQKVLKQPEDARVKLSVVEGVDHHHDVPAAVEYAVLERPALDDVKVDLVDILQVLSEFQDVHVDDAVLDLLVLVDEHTSQRWLARGSCHYLQIQLEVRHALRLSGVREQKGKTFL